MKAEVKNIIINSISNDENYLSIKEVCLQNKWEFQIMDFVNAYYTKNQKQHFINFSFNCNYIEENGNITSTQEEFRIQIGLVTKSGYFSTKELPILFVDSDNLNQEEICAALEYFNTQTKNNTFDPFFFENEIQRRNASAWSYIASNHLQEDCR
jgi:hypothetical protein